MPFTKEKMPWCPCPFKNEAYTCPIPSLVSWLHHSSAILVSLSSIRVLTMVLEGRPKFIFLWVGFQIISLLAGDSRCRRQCPASLPAILFVNSGRWKIELLIGHFLRPVDVEGHPKHQRVVLIKRLDQWLREGPIFTTMEDCLVCCYEDLP